MYCCGIMIHILNNSIHILLYFILYAKKHSGDNLLATNNICSFNILCFLPTSKSFSFLFFCAFFFVFLFLYVFLVYRILRWESTNQNNFVGVQTRKHQLYFFGLCLPILCLYILITINL